MASAPDNGPECVPGKVAFGQKRGSGAGRDEVSKVLFGIRRCQDYDRWLRAAWPCDLLREIEAALVTEADVDERDIGPELGDSLTCLHTIRRHTDNGDPLSLEQVTRNSDKAVVVVDDQAPNSHGSSMAAEDRLGITASGNIGGTAGMGSKWGLATQTADLGTSILNGVHGPPAKGKVPCASTAPRAR